jgi:hypothetical protein
MGRPLVTFLRRSKDAMLSKNSRVAGAGVSDSKPVQFASTAEKQSRKAKAEKQEGVAPWPE